jgi:hypothetical protein
MGPTGGTITEHYDIELVLSGSGSVYTGTVTASGGSQGTKTYNVEGTFDGTTFMMTAHYGWDGVSYLTPVYAITVEGSEMYGSATYLNVGVPIHGTFDLKKGGMLAVGGITPAVSGLVIGISIVAIVVASSSPRVPKAGFKPQTGAAPAYQPSYQPSQQRTTETPPQPMSGDGTVPLGGAGLQYGTPAPSGRPFPPKEHFAKVSQEPPRCPVHNNVALAPHFSNTDMNDPGSWYCPKCKGYPWGRTEVIR